MGDSLAGAENPGMNPDLLRYLDDLLNPEETAALARRLAEEPDLQKELARLCVQVQALEEISQTDKLTTDLMVGVQEAMPAIRSSKTIHARKTARRWPTWVGVSAAAALTAIVFWQAWPPSSIQDGQPEIVKSDVPKSSPADSSVGGVTVATLEGVQGVVRLKSSDGALRLVKTGDAIRSGETLVVEAQNEDSGDDLEESWAVAVYTDGAAVRVSPGSQVSLLTGDRARQVFLHRGIVHIQVAANASTSPFILLTDHAQVAALGTLRLYSETNLSRIELDEGTAKLTRKEDGRVVDMAERSFVVTNNNPASPMEGPSPLASMNYRLLRNPTRIGSVLAFSGHGDRLATYSERGLHVLDLLKGTAQTLPGLKSTKMQRLAFVDQEEHLVAGISHHGAGAIWDLKTQRIRNFPLPRSASGVGLSSNGQWAAAAYTGKPHEVAVWRFGRDNGPQWKWELPYRPGPLALSDQGTRVAIASLGHVNLDDPMTGMTVFRTSRMSRPVTRLALSGDGRYLAAAAYQGEARLFDVETKTSALLWTLEDMTATVVRFSPDGKRLVAGFSDGTVRIWSVPSGDLMVVIDTGDAIVRDAAISPDGITIGTLTARSGLKLWQVQE